jgi:RNA 3'-phosphate cyclase
MKESGTCRTISIDGSFGSGGGQILRTSVGLSALTGMPCRIENIRSGRPKPGLRAQHLSGIKAVAELCGAELEGAEIGSTEISFRPGSIRPGSLDIDVGTAGSVTLVLQALMIPAIRSPGPVEFRITGGTHVAWSPTTGYFRHVFSGFMKKMGIEISSETLCYGYYPKGGGGIKATVRPVKELKPILLEKREGSQTTEAWSNASRQLIKPSVGERQVDGAGRVLKIDKRSIKYVPSASVGSSVTIAASFDNCFLGASALGERGKPAESVGEEAGRELKKALDTKATVDRHMADQIIPYMAMASGESRIVAPEITDHTKTNIWVTEKFLKTKFQTSGLSGGFMISCDGA